MKYLKNFNLYESNQRGNLYHVFDIEKCIYIINRNKLSSYHFSNISTTRNKLLNGYIGSGPTSIFKLELNGDEISNNYKIKPFQYQSYVGTERKPVKLHEFEEVILTNEIVNINKYVKKFIIIKDNIENGLKNSGWFDSDGGNVNDKHKNIPDFLKEYLPKIKQLFGDIWIQEGSIIKKDDKWLEKIINYPIKKTYHGYALCWRGEKRVKSNNFDGEIIKDDIQFLDNRNENLDTLVIGKEYENIYLNKSKKIKLPKSRENYDLFLFDFEYKLKNVIKKTETYIFVSKGKLIFPDFLMSKNK
jgi:hypothetical protein